MRFDIITIFPEAVAPYLATSIIGRARKLKKIDVRIHNLRDATKDRHRTVDDRPYGGGPGMVMRVEPFVRTLRTLRVRPGTKSTRIILLSASGAVFTQRRARALAAHTKRIILLCGRYEGVDARLSHYIDEELSVGEYVLTGGELPALTVLDAVTRLLPGVLGDDASSADESYSDDATVEYPQYTRPEVFDRRRVPDILLSGDHKRIMAWRKDQRRHHRKKPA